MFVRRDVVEREAGGSIELAHGFGQDDGPFALHGDRVHAGQVKGGAGAHLVQLGAEAWANTPDFAHLCCSQQRAAFGFADGAQVADLRMVRGVAAGFALGAFGDGVGELGQGLGRADADASRDADPLVDAGADFLGALYQVTGDAVQVHKAFIDGVGLLPVTQACGQGHHAVAHVAVQGEVRGQGHQARCALQLAQLEVGRAHLDAQGLGFVAARNRAAVVVSE